MTERIAIWILGVASQWIANHLGRTTDVTVWVIDLDGGVDGQDANYFLVSRRFHPGG